MIEVKKISADAKISLPNMDYQMVINGNKTYYTEKDIIELKDKLNLLLTPVKTTTDIEDIKMERMLRMKNMKKLFAILNEEE